MVLKLISSTPSPFARKVRIALAEKGIPFEIQWDVPWDGATKTTLYNPLEKLPILISETGNSIYESHFILEWLEFHYPPPNYVALYPQVKERELFAKQVQIVTDGMCDALILIFFERQRKHPSDEWMARQQRKVDGGMKSLSKWVGDKEFIFNNKFSIADIAAGSMLGYVRVRFPENKWQEQYPNLKTYSDKLEERQSFKSSVPTPQTIKDRIV